MSGYLLKFKQTYSVKIGGRRYPVVKIGNQLWMAENLDWKWDGLDLSTRLNGNSSTPNGIYYNGDETTYGAEGRKCGMLYNEAAKNVVNQKLQDSNVTDWHLPTYTDFITLKESINDVMLEGMKLSSGDLSWASSWNGTNDYGFSALPSGQRYQGTGEYHDAGNAICLWSTDDGYVWLMSLDGSTITPLTRYSVSSKPLYSIRLVSFDYGKVTIGGRDYKTVKIGNQEWLAENLDYKPTGVTVGTNAWYYNNDEQTYGYRGLLYSWNGVSAVIDSNLLPSGWRVPSKADFDNLVLAVGSDAAKKLKASSFGGTDDYGFSILNAGYYAGVFGDGGTGFWTTSDYSSGSKDAPWFYYNSDSWSWDHITYIGTTNSIPIRLVKSLT